MSAVFNRTAENGGLETLVPTTSIFTLLDEFILPQASNSTGPAYLSGASNIAIQDACGRKRIVDHLYALALSALADEDDKGFD
ncbi:uncharacterized protein MELLADRAFT_93206 [Melampsora larici-populina 98AG31]|uniref:Uncharacterized protein n=1 Tax=Melampsora larici-populina (strain 98AG31 / pathotype 3-4-7) TaxID=747676 RepID=F4S474_MELLP|nr:uncharacterized protein MELLADRAFT_93206 [Melampsora larici-populina 98AG31]EGG00534.1 hypothetical protein MELLADRAFT_93206 [Melampsora larici-populina 98AG31]